MTRDETEARQLFRERYALDRQDVNREVERAVIGGDWGANGYTTMAQADELGRLVGARPGLRLLDVGAGRGWPGLYLAATTGCAVVLSDLPIEGLRLARRRAAAEGLTEQVTAVVASASHPPVKDSSIDGIVAADVICWLSAKLSVLRACRRMLRPGGVLALTTIELAEGITRAERRATLDAAPRAVGSRRPYPQLLTSAGFVGVGARDVTGDYLTTTRAWLAASEPVADRLAAVDGTAAVEERLQGWRDAIAAVERGHLRRTIYWGRR